MAAPKIDTAAGRLAIQAWQRDGDETERMELATAVRYTLQLLVEKAPGPTVEVRVPPFGAVQCVAGPKHTRGTPPNVVEMNTQTWLALATGAVSWQEARTSGWLKASGVRSDISELLPLRNW